MFNEDFFINLKRKNVEVHIKNIFYKNVKRWVQTDYIWYRYEKVFNRDNRNIKYWKTLKFSIKRFFFLVEQLLKLSLSLQVGRHQLY